MHEIIIYPLNGLTNDEILEFAARYTKEQIRIEISASGTIVAYLSFPERKDAANAISRINGAIVNGITLNANTVEVEPDIFGDLVGPTDYNRQSLFLEALNKRQQIRAEFYAHQLPNQNTNQNSNRSNNQRFRSNDSKSDRSSRSDRSHRSSRDNDREQEFEASSRFPLPTPSRSDKEEKSRSSNKSSRSSSHHHHHSRHHKSSYSESDSSESPKQEKSSRHSSHHHHHRSHRD